MSYFAKYMIDFIINFLQNMEALRQHMMQYSSTWNRLEICNKRKKFGAIVIIFQLLSAKKNY